MDEPGTDLRVLLVRQQLRKSLNYCLQLEFKTERFYEDATFETQLKLDLYLSNPKNIPNTVLIIPYLPAIA